MRKVTSSSTPAVSPTSSPAAKKSGGYMSSDPFAADDLGLTMYDTPPDVEVSLREFEEFTRDRLKVLHVFDRLCTYDTNLQQIDDLKPKVMKELRESSLTMDYPTGLNSADFQQRKADFAKRDSVSHFAMRLAFCKTNDARDWFVRQESRLFSLRFEELRAPAKEAFIARSGLKCKRWEVSENSKELQDMQKVTPGARIWKDGAKPEFEKTFYLMPFYEVEPNLIANRKVVVKAGKAYVPASLLKVILATKFKASLKASLDQAFAGLQTAMSDPRIGGFLRDLQDYGMQLLVAPKASTEDVGVRLAVENFEMLLTRSFPPCMRRVVEKQREMKKHLKHAGRLQLRPFLKECGFTIEESIQWWKKELCRDPTIDAASFEKNYTYDLEHTYGKKGHLQGANSFGCPKLIGFPAEAAGQFHGCPFKVLEGATLKQQMHKWKIPEPYVNEMHNLVSRGNHYQLACIEYFKATHEGHPGDGVGNNPGDFFRESCRYYTKKAEKEGEKQGESPAKPAAAPVAPAAQS